MILHTLPDNKQYCHFQRIFRQTILKNFSIFHIIIKQYWHFQRVIGKQYYTLFQGLYQAILHFYRVPSKLNYSKNFFYSSYHKNKYWHIYWVTTNNIDLFRAHVKQHSHLQRVIPNNSDHLFASLNGHLRQKILNWKIL